MAQEIHLGDVGTKILVTVYEDGEILDLSEAETKQLRLKKPSGETVTKTGSYETDGTDGQIYYLTASGDLDEVGRWRVQAILDFGETEFRSDISSFFVYGNL